MLHIVSETSVFDSPSITFNYPVTLLLSILHNGDKYGVGGNVWVIKFLFKVIIELGIKD